MWYHEVRAQEGMRRGPPAPAMEDVSQGMLHLHAEVATSKARKCPVGQVASLPQERNSQELITYGAYMCAHVLEWPDNFRPSSKKEDQVP
jgi:hypothetical protein